MVDQHGLKARRPYLHICLFYELKFAQDWSRGRNWMVDLLASLLEEDMGNWVISSARMIVHWWRECQLRKLKWLMNVTGALLLSRQHLNFSKLSLLLMFPFNNVADVFYWKSIRKNLQNIKEKIQVIKKKIISISPLRFLGKCAGGSLINTRPLL